MADDRRSFLRKVAAGAGAAWTVPTIVSTKAASAATDPLPPGPLLDVPAALAPIDHVVVVMMENRSFDHWLGWLATDATYVADGQSRYGGGFYVDGQLNQIFAGPSGPVATQPMLTNLPPTDNPWRGCNHPDPGHSWTAGRAERDGGFLAPGSGNDVYALGYFTGDDLPMTAALARRFTVADRSFASLLGPTYPNREYLYSAQSGGNKTNFFPANGFTWETIIERLVAAGVSVRSYYTDIPTIALFGNRMAPYVAPIADFATDTAAGTLPNVSFVDPRYLSDDRSDNHPPGDVRAGEHFLQEVFAPFARSPQWSRGLLILTFDEWGGFFDHVAPPLLPDDLANLNDTNNFGQAGFRVPTILASPYTPRGFVDHRTYDHTSILRFLEWRFLGAPPEGPTGSGWFLTTRDRFANNIGGSLVTTPDLDPDFDLDLVIDPASGPCGSPYPFATPSPLVAASVAAPLDADDTDDTGDAMFALAESGYLERNGFTIL